MFYEKLCLNFKIFGTKTNLPFIFPNNFLKCPHIGFLKPHISNGQSSVALNDIPAVCHCFCRPRVRQWLCWSSDEGVAGWFGETQFPSSGVSQVIDSISHSLSLLNQPSRQRLCFLPLLYSTVPILFNNHSGHPPFVSNTITIMATTAPSTGDDSVRHFWQEHPSLAFKTSTIAHLSGADGKTNQIKFNGKLYRLPFVYSLSLSQNLMNTMDSSKPLINIFSFAFQANESSLTRISDSSQMLNSTWLAILIIMQMSALPED